MNAALVDDKIVLSALSTEEFQIIKSWNTFRWDRQKKAMVGDATTETIPKIYHVFKATNADLVNRYKELKRIEDAVTAERENKDPKPLVKPPIKLSMYKHQVRGFNMCLLAFDLVEPMEVQNE